LTGKGNQNLLLFVNSLQSAAAHIVPMLLAITLVAIPFGSLLYMAEQGLR
jgi:hypothetical protein